MVHLPRCQSDVSNILYLRIQLGATVLPAIFDVNKSEHSKLAMPTEQLKSLNAN